MVSPTQPQPVQALPDPIKYRHPRGAHKRRVVPADGIIPSDEQEQSGKRKAAKRPHGEMSGVTPAPTASMSRASGEGTRSDIDLPSNKKKKERKEAFVLYPH